MPPASMKQSTARRMPRSIVTASWLRSNVGPSDEDSFVAAGQEPCEALHTLGHFLLNA